MCVCASVCASVCVYVHVLKNKERSLFTWESGTCAQRDSGRWCHRWYDSPPVAVSFYQTLGHVPLESVKHLAFEWNIATDKHRQLFRNGYLTQWQHLSRTASRSRHRILVSADVSRRSLGTGDFLPLNSVSILWINLWAPPGFSFSGFRLWPGELQLSLQREYIYIQYICTVWTFSRSHGGAHCLAYGIG